MHRIVSLLILVLLAFTLNAQQFELRELLDGNDPFTLRADEFVPKHKFFRWLSAGREGARYAAFKNPVKLTFLGFPVLEAILYFENNQLTKLYVSLYNKGDAGEIDYGKFEMLVARFNEALSRQTGEKGTEQRGRLANNMVLYANFRVSDDILYTVKWSASGHLKRDMKPQYLQFEMEPFNPKDDPRKQSLVRVDRTKIETSKDLAANVRRKADGTVWIDNIPMVDQGAKGYCVAAVLERILKYYGIDDVNQHTLAQIMKMQGNGATSAMMLDALDKAGSKFGIKAKTRYSAEIETIEDLSKLISKYNNLARRAKKKKIAQVQKGNIIFVGQTMAQMDPGIFRKLRCDGYSRAMNSFRRDIQSRVNAGLPVGWCVLLGLVNEKQKTLQVAGAHMRLIIGYNAADDTIVYTDTWGSGHEFKTMSLEDAWVMTMRTIYINPRTTR